MGALNINVPKVCKVNIYSVLRGSMRQQHIAAELFIFIYEDFQFQNKLKLF